METFTAINAKDIVDGMVISWNRIGIFSEYVDEVTFNRNGMVMIETCDYTSTCFCDPDDILFVKRG